MRTSLFPVLVCLSSRIKIISSMAMPEDKLRNGSDMSMRENLLLMSSNNQIKEVTVQDFLTFKKFEECLDATFTCHANDQVQQ